MGNRSARVQGGGRASPRARRRRQRLIAGVVLLGLVASAATYLGWKYGWSAAGEGDSAPRFVLPDHQGRQVALADYLGRKAVVLVFYMTYG
jgi:cytochrome oxidase Cu insertion factor (SCO1/SenC/PrrC family)